MIAFDFIKLQINQNIINELACKTYENTSLTVSKMIEIAIGDRKATRAIGDLFFKWRSKLRWRSQNR